MASSDASIIANFAAAAEEGSGLVASSTSMTTGTEPVSVRSSPANEPMTISDEDEGLDTAYEMLAEKRKKAQ